MQLAARVSMCSPYKAFFIKPESSNQDVYTDFVHVDDVYFSAWASWGDCSAGCEGVMYKTRDCQEADISLCASLTNVSISCESQICPGKWLIS